MNIESSVTFTGRLCRSGERASVRIENHQIAAVEVLDDQNTQPSDIWISSGWIDLQVNGYGGWDFNRSSWSQGQTGPEAAHHIARSSWKSGTAMACPTIVTSSREGIIESLRGLAQSIESDAVLSRTFPAIHLEGPYISSEEGLRGAHPVEHTRDPDWDEFQEFQEAANGRLKLVTIAPERDGSTTFIERAVASGVTVSLGHTGASAAQIKAAIDAGARLNTHLGNGSQNMIQRHTNYFFEQLANDDMTACIIADGHHLPAQLTKIIARVKGEEKLVLVSDTVALGGMKPGIYDNGRHEVLETGKVVLAGTPYLAGAGHLLDHCAANVLGWGVLNERGLERAAATNPARVLGMKNSGEVKPGNDADLTVFRVTENGSVEIEKTVLKGEVLYSRE